MPSLGVGSEVDLRVLASANATADLKNALGLENFVNELEEVWTQETVAHRAKGPTLQGQRCRTHVKSESAACTFREALPTAPT